MKDFVFIQDANNDSVYQRQTELSDVIRAKNKREERFLNVRLRFYEREKNIRLNILRKEQRQLERLRTSISKEADRIENEKQMSSLPAWIQDRVKSEGQILPNSVPEFTVNDWEENSSIFQSEIFPLPTPNTIRPVTEVTRRHSAR